MTRHLFLILAAILWALSRCIIVAILLALTLLLLHLACGCTRHTQPVEIRTEHHTLYTDSLSRLLATTLASRTTERDKETVYVFTDRASTVTTAGDTTRQSDHTLVIRDTSHERDTRVYQSRIDSLHRVIADKDSLLAEKPVRIEVPAALSAWQRIRIGSFWPLLSILLALLIWHRWGHLFLRRQSF